MIADPFVVSPPTGARVRTRLRVSPADEDILRQVGAHLGHLASTDLAQRCREGRLGAKAQAESRRRRKQAMTAASSSRWAGAITRVSEDRWQLAVRNLSICRGGRKLARVRHHLAAVELDQADWRQRWEAQRWFLTADGEALQALGNLTIRWHPGEDWVDIRLPRPLEHLANRPHGRYRLSCPVSFPYRGGDIAAQAASGAVRYDIAFEAGSKRWYLDASWGRRPSGQPDLTKLRQHPVLAVDLNASHLAAWVIDRSGNPVGAPQTIPLELAGLPAGTRDGRLRAAVSELIDTAQAADARAVVIEDLNFATARDEGRERAGRRPNRGTSGRRFRRAAAGIPTARFRDRLVQMAYKAGLEVVAVDPAYTSRWGAQHWLAPLRHQASCATGHHAAAVVIGRRALGQRARRRARCDPDPPVDGTGRATRSAAWPVPAPAGLPGARSRNTGPRKACGQPPRRRKTRQADRSPPADQAAQDRSELPADQDSLPISA